LPDNHPNRRPEAFGAVLDDLLILRHQHVLGDHVPLRFGVGESRAEPIFLRKTHHGAAGVEPLRATSIGLDMAAALVRRSVTGLAGAVLPAVDHRNLDQITEGKTIVDPHHRALGMRQDRPHRHVFVECLIGRRALLQETRRLNEPLRPLIGVVVLHLVIVPGDERRHLRMQALQIRVEAILGVAAR